MSIKAKWTLSNTSAPCQSGQTGRIQYSRTLVFFTWEGFDEMDEVRGTGSAKLQDDGTIQIEFAYNYGDEATLKAERATSSTAC